MRLAHLSDVHVLDLQGVPWTRFINKRLTGLVNILGNRRHAHPTHLLEAAVAELAGDRSIDHVVVTGDLTNLSLEAEFVRARAVLEPLAGRISVIPGNHDAYTRGAARSRRFEHFFGDWMWTGADLDYPWVKTVGDIALLGFSSAVARLPFIATGCVSAAQLDHLEALHRSGALTGRCPVALVHHNVHPRGLRKDTLHGLANRDPFIAALAAAGVKVLLHGHTHLAHRFVQDGVSIIGSGSSTWSSVDPAKVARYNVYELDREGLRTVEVRRWDELTAAFVPQGETSAVSALDRIHSGT